MINPKIIAIVVTYQPNIKILNDLLLSLVKQVDIVVVVIPAVRCKSPQREWTLPTRIRLVNALYLISFC